MNSETKVISIILAITALIIVFGLSLTKNNGPRNTIQIDSTILIASTTPVKGANDAVVSIVEFADFACPACAMLHPNLTEAMNPYFSGNASSSGKISYALRLIPIHGSDSIISATAAFAAGKQDKFFEMGSVLLEKQSEWEGKSEEQQKELFTSYAQSLGLRTGEFKSYLDSPDFRAEIINILEADNADATKMGINSTPTMIINGKKSVVGVQSVTDLKQIIETALQENTI